MFTMPTRLCFVGLGLFSALTQAKEAPVARELVLYRPATSTFYVEQSGANTPAVEVRYGTAGDIPLVADFNGDGKWDQLLYRKGQWFVSTRADGRAEQTIDFGGEADDVPLAADVDGDGKADLVIFRAGEWHVRGSRNLSATTMFVFGVRGDTPLLADFDGDGKKDFAVFRAGNWIVDTNHDGKADLNFTFGGVAGELPLAADWNGDGRADLILFRKGVWLICSQRDGKVQEEKAFGAAGDIPFVAIPR